MQRSSEYAGGQVARGSQSGLLGNRDYMNTPFNQTSYTAGYIQNYGAQDLIDVVASDPGTRAFYAPFSYDDRLSIRGFPSYTFTWGWDNLPGLVPQQGNDLSGVERVEIHKGPTALTNGMATTGGVGGTVNLVPKRATDEPINQITTGYISNSVLGVHGDFGRRFGDQKEFGIRGNVAYRNGQTGTDYNAIELTNLTVGADYRGEKTRVSFDIQHLNRNLDGPRGGTFLAAGLAVPAAPNAHKNYYQPWEYMNTQNTGVMGRVEHDLTSNVTLFGAIGHKHHTGQFVLGFPFITNAAGDTANSVDYYGTYYKVWSGEAGVRAKAYTGPVKHEAVVAYSQTSEEQGNSFFSLSNVTNNIFNPSPSPAPNFAMVSTSVPKTGLITLKSVAVADVMSVFDDRVQLTLGARHQQVLTDQFSPITGALTSAADVNHLSPGAAILVKPLEHVALYANYIEALEVVAPAPPGTLNAGQLFAPAVAKQKEVGIKGDFYGLGTVLSFFDIERPSAFTNTSKIYVVDGLQRNRGVEWEVFGQVARDVRVLGGVMIIDGRLENTAIAANNGNRAPGVANFQANAGVEWDTPFVPGLTLWGRSLYTGEAYIDAANTQSAPAWVRYDLGARYTFKKQDGKPVTVRASVINIADKNYWIASGGYLTQNAPRTYMVSATFNF